MCHCCHSLQVSWGDLGGACEELIEYEATLCKVTSQTCAILQLPCFFSQAVRWDRLSQQCLLLAVGPFRIV